MAPRAVRKSRERTPIRGQARGRYDLAMDKVLLDEGRNAAEHLGSIADAHARIATQDALRAASLDLVRSVFPPTKGVRLVGVNVANFEPVESDWVEQLNLALAAGGRWRSIHRNGQKGGMPSGGFWARDHESRRSMDERDWAVSRLSAFGGENALADVTP